MLFILFNFFFKFQKKNNSIVINNVDISFFICCWLQIFIITESRFLAKSLLYFRDKNLFRDYFKTFLKV